MVKVSIIIPAYNEEETVGDCIKTLLRQSYKNFEIIIVDDGSVDETTQIVKEFIKKDRRVRLIKGQHKGPGFSRNIGAKKAKGKILVFVDADMTFDKDFIKYLIEPILNKETIGTENLQIASNQENIWSKCWGLYFNNERFIGKKAGGYIFRAILKKEFDKMGGFDPTYGYADDQTFFIKYGIRPLGVSKAICYHENPGTLKEVYKQSIWIGASLNNPIFFIPLIKYLLLSALIVISPILIPILAFKKAYKNKYFNLLVPWMLIFMAVRYFGTIVGIFNKVVKGKNTR